MTKSLSRFFPIGVLLLFGCSAKPPDLPLPDDHPASARAAEAPPTTRSNTLSTPVLPAGSQGEASVGAPGATPRAHVSSAHASQGSAQADFYTCPMHPEVRSTSPGRCSVCGMTLELHTAPHHGNER